MRGMHSVTMLSEKGALWVITCLVTHSWQLFRALTAFAKTMPSLLVQTKANRLNPKCDSVRHFGMSGIIVCDVHLNSFKTKKKKTLESIPRFACSFQMYLICYTHTRTHTHTHKHHMIQTLPNTYFPYTVLKCKRQLIKDVSCSRSSAGTWMLLGFWCLWSNCGGTQEGKRACWPLTLPLILTGQWGWGAGQVIKYG